MSETLAQQLAGTARDGEVEIGERVTLLDLTTAATLDCRVVASGEADPALGKLSPGSPLGSALLGRRVGDIVELALTRGSVRFEVVEIDG